jgi:hypothetical protein
MEQAVENLKTKLRMVDPRLHGSVALNLGKYGSLMQRQHAGKWGYAALAIGVNASVKAFPSHLAMARSMVNHWHFTPQFELMMQDQPSIVYAAGTAHVAACNLKKFLHCVREWFVKWLAHSCEDSNGSIVVNPLETSVLCKPGKDDRHFVTVYLHQGVLIDARERDRFARRLRCAPQLKGMYWWPHKGRSKTGAFQMVQGIQSPQYKNWLPTSECFASTDFVTCHWEPEERIDNKYSTYWLFGDWPEEIEERILRGYVTNVPVSARPITVRETYVRTLPKRQKYW